MDDLGVNKYMNINTDSISFDTDLIWNRYGGDGSKEEFENDGNIVINGIFDWIVKDKQLMQMVDIEFNMYRYHLAKPNGNENLGWQRNMWHSLIQQVIFGNVMMCFN